MCRLPVKRLSKVQKFLWNYVAANLAIFGDKQVLGAKFFTNTSSSFLILLHGCKLIQYNIVMYFQACSNSAYLQQYRTIGPLVWANVLFYSSCILQACELMGYFLFILHIIILQITGLWANVFSSPHRWAYSIARLRCPSVAVAIRRPHSLNIFSSETSWPISQISYRASMGWGNESLFKRSRSHDQGGCHTYIW